MEQIKKSKKFRPRNRDLDILKFLATNKFITVKQIGEMFWNNKKRDCNYYRRIKTLANQGLIQKVQGDGNIILAYAITVKGRKFLKVKNISVPEQYENQVSYKSNFEHDRLLNEVGNILISCPLIGDFESEGIVRARLARRYGYKEKRDEGYKVPDATCKIKTKTKEQIIALELELTSKSETRYRKIFRQFYLSREWNIILYIVESQELKDRLMKILNDIRESDPLVKSTRIRPGFYFCELENLLDQKLGATFQGTGDAFTFRNLMENS